MSKITLESAKTPQEQMEFFSLQFVNSVNRVQLETALVSFLYNGNGKAELEVAEAMQLFEAEGVPLSAAEFNKAFELIDVNKNKTLSFLEYACFKFNKTWDELTAVPEVKMVETSDLKNAQQAVKSAANAAKAADADISSKLANKKAAEEAEAAAKAAADKAIADELAAEAKLTGVAAARAMFDRKINEIGIDVVAKNRSEVEKKYAKEKADKKLAEDIKNLQESVAKARLDATSALSKAESEALAIGKKNVEDQLAAQLASYESEKTKTAAEAAAAKKAEEEAAAAARAAFAQKANAQF